MVPLADADTEFEARVLVAKLGSAGIVAEVRGLCTPYPTLGTAQVWVEDSALDDARELIATPEAFPVFDGESDGEGDGESDGDRREQDMAWRTDHRWRNRLLVAVALVLLASFGLAPRCAPVSDRPTTHTR